MKKFCKVNIATDGKAEFGSYCGIPEQSKWTPSAESKYVVFCDNETIEGVEFAGDPEMEGKTLIKDVSSNFMSKPINIAKYGSTPCSNCFAPCSFFTLCSVSLRGFGVLPSPMESRLY